MVIVGISFIFTLNVLDIYVIVCMNSALIINGTGS